MRVAVMTMAVAAALGGGMACAQDTPIPVEQLTGSNQILSHDCGQGENLVLNGSSDRVTLTGACLAISITGSGNVIFATQAMDVTALGNNNQVTWPKMSVEPHLHFEGTGNSAGSQKG